MHHNNQQAMTEPSTPSVTVCVMAKRFTDCRGKLINLKNAWEQSGSGKVMATTVDGDKQAKIEKEVYEFKDGDDQQWHLYTTASHILYLCELSNQVQLLNKVCQQLSGECAADKQTPRVVSTKQLLTNKEDKLFNMSDINSHNIKLNGKH
jgi:hypothetical protein